jgi:hypothetical protein
VFQGSALQEGEGGEAGLGGEFGLHASATEGSLKT